MERNRYYRYKDTTYKVLGNCKMKDSDGSWSPAVRYENLLGEEFVRRKEEFENRFIPLSLSLGDSVIVTLHENGKMILLGVTEVIEVNDDFVRLKDSVKGAPRVIAKEINKRGAITFRNNWHYFFYNEATMTNLFTKKH